MNPPRRTLMLVLLLVLPALSPALEPPSAAQRERYRLDGSLSRRAAAARRIGNHRFSPALLQQALPRLHAAGLVPPATGPAEPSAPPSAWSFRALPSRGTVNVLALLISFADAAPLGSAASIDQKLFGDGEGRFPLESLRNYYRRASYGQLEIRGQTLGWYAAPYPRASVPETDSGREALIAEALAHYDAAGHDFSRYDNDGDGYIDYLIVVWTGPHQEWADFWWGYQTSFGDDGVVLDGKRLYTYSWQWESYLPETPVPFQPQTVIHETGHALGLPDFYDYDDDVGPDGGVGGLDMMDATRGDHNAFSKFMLDWLPPAFLTDGHQEMRLRPSSVNPDAAVLMPGVTPGSAYGEYFLVQNRDRAGNDQYLPGSGLLIWHVDARLQGFWWGGRYWEDFVCDNSYTDHKLLRLMEADGLEEIETGDGRGDAEDFYTAGAAFDALSTPSSDAYGDGGAAAASPTPEAIGGITADGADFVFQANAQARLSVTLEQASRGVEHSWLSSRGYVTLGLHLEPLAGREPPATVTAVLFRRDAAGEPFHEVSRLPATGASPATLTFTDRLLIPGILYDYQVLIIDSAGHTIGVSARRTL